MRRLALVALAAAAACGGEATRDAGPLDRLYFPTGLAVHEGRLLVTSSNADLRFDDERGGSVIALDPIPDPAAIPTGGAVNLRSFAGEIAVASAAACPALDRSLAVTATRGSNMLHVLRVSGQGALSCERCEIPLTGPFADPFPVAIACAGERARAFVGYMRSIDGSAWISEYDLAGGTLRHARIGAGPPRALAYDAARDRLYVAGFGTATPLRWIELRGCDLGLPIGAPGGCTVGEVKMPVSSVIELRGIALANASAAESRRAYLSARRYDVNSNLVVGAVLAVDLVDDAFGRVTPRLAREWKDLPAGVQDVRVLPERTGPDVVAAVVQDGELWLFDDATGATKVVGEGDDPTTGAPLLGHVLSGVAVESLTPDLARLYVASFRDGFVTPVDVPLADIDAATIVTTAGGFRRIFGGTPAP